MLEVRERKRPRRKMDTFFLLKARLDAQALWRHDPRLRGESLAPCDWCGKGVLKKGEGYALSHEELLSSPYFRERVAPEVLRRAYFERHGEESPPEHLRRLVEALLSHMEKARGFVLLCEECAKRYMTYPICGKPR